jgi:hypothetical protein
VVEERTLGDTGCRHTQFGLALNDHARADGPNATIVARHIQAVVQGSFALATAADDHGLVAESLSHWLDAPASRIPGLGRDTVLAAINRTRPDPARWASRLESSGEGDDTSAVDVSPGLAERSAHRCVLAVRSMLPEPAPTSTSRPGSGPMQCMSWAAAGSTWMVNWS